MISPLSNTSHSPIGSERSSTSTRRPSDSDSSESKVDFSCHIPESHCDISLNTNNDFNVVDGPTQFDRPLTPTLTDHSSISDIPRPILILTPSPDNETTINPKSCSSSISAKTVVADTTSPYPGKGTSTEPYLVDWSEGELENPYNWGKKYKWFLTCIIGLATFGITFASSSYSAGIKQIGHEFGSSEEQGIAGLSLYVLGFGLGPLIWAPLSEMIGRRAAFNLSYPFFTLFNLCGAVAHNIETMLVVRFLAGTFGSALLTNGMGQVGDLWEGRERALASSLFCLAPFLGPVFGPVAGGFIVDALGFRWIFWIQTIYAGMMLLLTVAFVPETYPPTLLRRKAIRLQSQASVELSSLKSTSEDFPKYIAKYDKTKRTKWEIVKVGMSRPFEMMFKELIVLTLGIYAAIVYATLYLFFTAFPIVFRQTRGWSTGLSGLAFLGIGLGLILGVLLNPLGNIPYSRASKNSRNGIPSPEARLYMTCVGAILLPIGLFIFAWTSPPPTHFIVPILASVPFGVGFLLIFTGVQVYIVDSYGVFAASALAANAVQRGVLATVFPLFSVKLYERLGLQWAGTLLAFLALVCTPLPFIFLKYGHRIRRKSSYIPTDECISPVQSDSHNSTEEGKTPFPRDDVTKNEADEEKIMIEADVPVRKGEMMV